jgi:acetyl esterase/lipase
MTTIRLWDEVPGLCLEEPVLEYYPPEGKASDGAVLILPGGGYANRAGHEGKGYADFLAAAGIHSFVCQYRVAPHRFPLPLLDARRAMRLIRARAGEFGIDPGKIAVMGSSAGGHLAALLSTYTDPVDGEGADGIDQVDPLPDLTILCYPVIHMPDVTGIAHRGSFLNLMGGEVDFRPVSPDLLVTEDTPPAFLWHTALDAGVDVRNSYLYAAALSSKGIRNEVHVFPDGGHGLGLAESEPHTAQWTSLLLGWLRHEGWSV